MIEFGTQQARRPYEAIVPLINVVFLILIFFLLAGQIQENEPVEVDLPSGQLDDVKPPESVQVFIADDGFAYTLDQIMEPKFVPYLLRSFFLREGHRSVEVRVDRNADAQHLIELMEGLREIEVEEVVVLTEKPVGGSEP